MDPGRKKLVLFGVVIIVICLGFILYVGSSAIPRFVIKVSEDDFGVLRIEYDRIYTRANKSTGAVKLTVQTNRDNLVIGTGAETSTELGCSWKFEKAGLHEMWGCLGDPVREFLVAPIDIEHNFMVCADLPWSMLYEGEPACKYIVLPPYQE